MDGSALGSGHVTRLGVPDNETCRARHRSHTRDRSRDVHACPRVRTSTPARYSRVDSPRPVRWNAVHGSPRFIVDPPEQSGLVNDSGSRGID